MNKPADTFDFLFATWEGGGHIPPTLAAARRLAARGHRVRIMSDDCNRPEIEAAGAQFVGYREAPNRPDKSLSTEVVRDWEAETPEEALGRLRDRVMCGAALAYARDVHREIQRRRPDLAVSSDLLYGPMIGAEAAGVPFAILAANICLHPIPGIPPFGPGFFPARDEAERQRDAEVAAASHAMFNQGLPAVNAARQAFGLPPLPELAAQVAAAQRYWLAVSRAFDFPAEKLPENLRYVGPELGDPAFVAQWDSPWPRQDPRPLVLVGFSTTHQGQAGALQRVADALGQLPVRGLITLGPVAGETLQTPANVVAVRSAPHGAVMREAALVVTHAGHGTVAKALAADLPLLCLPMGRDQHDNAARVAARGAGLVLPQDAPTEDLANALRRLLHEPGFRFAAQKLGAAVRKDAEHSTLIDELEQLAAESARLNLSSAQPESWRRVAGF